MGEDGNLQGLVFILSLLAQKCREELPLHDPVKNDGDRDN